MDKFKQKFLYNKASKISYNKVKVPTLIPTLNILKQCWKDGVTLPTIKGYQMVGNRVPESGQIYDHIMMGVEYSDESKQIIFNPALDINFTPGAHSCNPIGVIKRSEDSCSLLHYKFISLDYVIKNYRLLQKRLSDQNKACNFGCHYNQTIEQIKGYYEELIRLSRNVIDRG